MDCTSRYCEEQSDEAIQQLQYPRSGLLRYAGNDGLKTLVSLTTFFDILLADFALHLAHRMRPLMSALTVTAKGQITLRKDILKHLGVQPGDKIAVDKLRDGRVEIKAVRPAGKISDAFGFLKRKDRPSLSIEEMNQIASRGWAGKR